MAGIPIARSQPYREETKTVWFNPTDHTMHANVYYGGAGPNGHYNERHPTRFTFAPKAETEVPSRFDTAIQLVQCTDEDCRRSGYAFCMKNHVGTVVGGLAPQLQRRGSRAVLPDSLDPQKAEKTKQEAIVAAQHLARQSAEDAQILAASRLKEIAEEEQRTVAEEQARAKAEAEASRALEEEARLEKATRPAAQPTPDRKPGR